jgi:hypothetical protein
MDPDYLALGRKRLEQVLARTGKLSSNEYSATLPQQFRLFERQPELLIDQA